MKTNIKMQVTPEQSKKVQEICFANGIYWGGYCDTIEHINKPFLFIGDTITYSLEKDAFYGKPYAEIEADLFIRTNGTCIEDSSIVIEKDKESAEDEIEQARRQIGNLDGILAERGAVYGDYGVHANSVGMIMGELEAVHFLKNNSPMTAKNQTMNFYVVSKLVRLAATPNHEDSLKDAINYLKLMYKEIHGVEIQ